ncbi:MAG: hypothetical protein ACOY6K_20465 [Pseudomonadota bacterium]
MQSHPPDRNNPANPLLKVAALNLDKDYLEVSPVSKVKVIATLNFKRSSDMTGRATLKSGEDATVSFSLALKRASLHLEVVFEGGQRWPVKIERVAHISSLHMREKISDNISTEEQSRVELAGSAGGRAGVGSSGALVDAGAGGKIGAAKSGKASRKRKVSRTLSRSNVSATSAGSAVHWAIEPNMPPSGRGGEGEAWLDGELFKVNGKIVDACLVSWRHDTKIGVPTISASAFVTMPDLIVGDVKLITSVGDEVSIKDAVPEFRNPGILSSLPLASTKERFVRQVLRKHLVSQGMRTDGALVEICRAST